MSTTAERIIILVEKCESGNKSAFARKINVTPAYISKLGKNPNDEPSDRTITDICRVYHANEQWLRTGEGDMFLPRSRSQQLDDFIGEVKRDPDGTARKDLLETLARMKPEFWEQFAAFCDELHGQRSRTKK